MVDYANAGFEDPAIVAAEEHYYALDRILGALPLAFAMRWCEPGEMGCACLGCANGPEAGAGGLMAKGFTKADWEYWKGRKFGNNATDTRKP